MPPRHGKSEYVSKYLPSWFLGKNPDKRVILTSYEASFAASWGRKSRNLLEEHGHGFFQEVADSPSAADNWNIKGHEGGMSTAGAGGAITGKGAHLAIIDDPIKNAEEASSEVIRNKIWDWYQSTLYTRLEPDGVLILVQTRWHEDDLAGRLIRQAKNGEGEPWRILTLPAIREENLALWPERYSLADLQRIRKAVGAYTWESLYQQNPTPREGSFFKVNKFNFCDSEPSGLSFVRAWDMGATEDDGDYTAGVKIGKDKEGRFYVCDVKRGQWATDERDSWITHTAGMDGRKCSIRVPQDPGQAGKSQALFMTRLLAGYSVKAQVVSGDKMTRADAYSSQVNAGNVWIVKGDWNSSYIEELRQFDKGKHDDQVDASADAFNALATKQTAIIIGIPGGDSEPHPSDRNPFRAALVDSDRPKPVEQQAMTADQQRKRIVI